MSKTGKTRPNFRAAERMYFRPRDGESDEHFGQRLKDGVLAAIADYKREHPDEAADTELRPEHAEAYLRGRARLERMRASRSEQESTE
jgi:hypothetical protein